MKKKYWLLLSLTVILAAAGWYGYQIVVDDTYEGMSIIPEQHKDIPLYPGLEPTRNDYVMEGDSWREVADFYKKQLPKHGWKQNFLESVLDDNDPENDWGGFYSEWTKEGFDGVLWLSAGYNQFDNLTEVRFDKGPILQSTTWIDQAPKSICIHADALQSECVEVTDQDAINTIVHFINQAVDLKETALSRDKESKIDFGTFDVYIHYGKDDIIYLWSEKGTKTMKPEPEFLALTKLAS